LLSTTTGTPICLLSASAISRMLMSLPPPAGHATINVIEVSSFQLDAIVTFRPHVAALLNVTPDHLDRYADFAAYRSSKFRIFENQKETDIAVLNRDDSNVFPPPDGIRAQKHLFSRTDGVVAGAFRFGGMLYLNGHAVMSASDVLLRGEHNIENVLASMAITSKYSVPGATLAEVVEEFPGVEHRIEYVGSVRGISYFNDSKATNVDSAVKAVASFERNLILILGGRDKGASYGPLVEAMRGKVRHVLLIGEAADKISAAVGIAFPVTRAPSLQDAVKQSASIGKPGDVVLELVGHPGVVDEGLRMTAPEGTYVEIGNINVGWKAEFDPSWIIFGNRRILGLSHYEAEHLRGALDLMRRTRTRYPWDKVVSHKFPLEAINDAFAQQDKGHVTRAAIVP
jgi:UDP-N-acetylmuramoylalanine--D-glutamate ligase